MNEKPVSRRLVVASLGAISVTGIIGCSAATEEVAPEPASPSATPNDTMTAETSTEQSATGLIAVSEIPVGGAVILSEEKVVLTQPTPGEVNAFSVTCTHQGCPVSQVSDQGIVCACHNSIFSTLDGSVVSGPATRALDAVAVYVEGDQVFKS